MREIKSSYPVSEMMSILNPALAKYQKVSPPFTQCTDGSNLGECVCVCGDKCIILHVSLKLGQHTSQTQADLPKRPVDLL